MTNDSMPNASRELPVQESGEQEIKRNESDSPSHHWLFGIGLAAGLIIAALASAVVPKFAMLFKGFGADLPVATQWVLDNYLAFWLVPIIVVAARVVIPDKRLRAIAACAIGVVTLLIFIPLLVLLMYLPIFKIPQVN